MRRASGARDPAGLRLGHARGGRRSLVVIVLGRVGLGGVGVGGVGIRGQVKPRTFTPAQQKRIAAWEVAKRWRTTPKSQIFPLVIRYTLPSAAGAKGGGLKLSAKRLEIARQASCVKAAGGSQQFMSVLGGDGCAALLRSTYTDSSSSLVLTTGIAVLQDQASAMAASVFLTGGATAA